MQPFVGHRLSRLFATALLMLTCGTMTDLQSAAAHGDPVPKGSPADPYREAAKRIIDAALSSDVAYDRLVALCDDIGHRISGSANLELAIKWAAALLKTDGQENIRLEPVQVPKWVRGKESLMLTAPREISLSMLGLGWSVGTPAQGLEAEVVVARDEAELKALGDRVKGRIVLFNNAMPPYDHVRGTRYGHTVRFRSRGARMVAELGGVAVLVRSVTAHSLQTPHTGTQSYGKGQPPIPAAAVTVEGAELIARNIARGKTVKAKLSMQAKMMPDATSHNVIAELRGREHPDEVVIVSGHIDSWDVGQGAHDDGGGVVMAMETIRLLRTLGLRPRRTIRAVLYTNEENGLRGAKAYAKVHAEELSKHVAAIEADAGAFAPTGYTLQHHDPSAERRALRRLRGLVPLLAPLGADHAAQGFAGADIGPLRPAGVPLMGHRTNMEKYFDLHHTAADTVDKVDPGEFARNVAAMAVMAYVLAEMPERLDAPDSE